MAEITASFIARLDLDPARKDVLVVQGVPPEEMGRAHALMSGLVPAGIRILFLPDDVRLTVMTDGHKDLDEWEAATTRFTNGP